MRTAIVILLLIAGCGKGESVSPSGSAALPTMVEMAAAIRSTPNEFGNEREMFKKIGPRKPDQFEPGQGTSTYSVMWWRFPCSDGFVWVENLERASDGEWKLNHSSIQFSQSGKRD